MMALAEIDQWRNGGRSDLENQQMLVNFNALTDRVVPSIQVLLLLQKRNVGREKVL